MKGDETAKKLVEELDAGEAATSARANCAR